MEETFDLETMVRKVTEKVSASVVESTDLLVHQLRADINTELTAQQNKFADRMDFLQGALKEVKS
jgi:hypothetical protein